MAENRSSNQTTTQANQERGRENQPRGGQLTRHEQNQGLLTPFGFMRRFTEDIDRLFDDFMRNPFGLTRGTQGSLLTGLGGLQGTWSPQIEMFQRDSDLVVRAELPGLNKDDVQVEINDDVLTIQGERRQEREENRGGLFHSERVYGNFYRAVPLPEGVIAESAKATFKNGVLEITLQAPPAETRRGRRLEIQDASQQKK